MEDGAVVIDCRGPQISNQVTLGNRLVNLAGSRGAGERGFRMDLSIGLSSDYQIEVRIDYSDLDELPIEMLEVPIGLAVGDDAIIAADSEDIFQVVGRLLKLKVGARLPAVTTGMIILRGRSQQVWEFINSDRLQKVPYLFQRGGVESVTGDAPVKDWLSTVASNEKSVVAVRGRIAASTKLELSFWESTGGTSSKQVKVVDFKIVEEAEGKDWQWVNNLAYIEAQPPMGSSSNLISGSFSVRATVGAVSKCPLFGKGDHCEMKLSRLRDTFYGEESYERTVWSYYCK